MQKNMGAYLRLMRDGSFGADKTRAALTQLKDLHRNSLAHPEDILDLEEAISLLGIVQSVITEMLKEMPDITPEQPQFPLVVVPAA